MGKMKQKSQKESNKKKVLAKLYSICEKNKNFVFDNWQVKSLFKFRR
ncbi:hypothetical protein BH20ACI1_BH20ACI1_15550 [soil metagenome]